jgi:hypothetical protein
MHMNGIGCRVMGVEQWVCNPIQKFTNILQPPIKFGYLETKYHGKGPHDGARDVIKRFLQSK